MNELRTEREIDAAAEQVFRRLAPRPTEVSDVLLHAAVCDGVYVDLNARPVSTRRGGSVLARVEVDPPSIRIDRTLAGRRRFAFVAATAYGLLVLGAADARGTYTIPPEGDAAGMHRAARRFAVRLLRRLAAVYGSDTAWR